MILIDYKDRRPLYEQIVEKLSDLMVRGVLAQDSQLPSVRSLATELSINPNTIQRAYAELERQGYIYSVKGRGSFVAEFSILFPRKPHKYQSILSFAEKQDLVQARAQAQKQNLAQARNTKQKQEAEDDKGGQSDQALSGRDRSGSYPCGDSGWHGVRSDRYERCREEHLPPDGGGDPEAG